MQKESFSSTAYQELHQSQETLINVRKKKSGFISSLPQSTVLSYLAVPTAHRWDKLRLPISKPHFSPQEGPLSWGLSWRWCDRAEDQNDALCFFKINNRFRTCFGRRELKNAKKDVGKWSKKWEFSPDCRLGLFKQGLLVSDFGFLNAVDLLMLWLSAGLGPMADGRPNAVGLPQEDKT